MIIIIIIIRAFSITIAIDVIITTFIITLYILYYLHHPSIYLVYQLFGHLSTGKLLSKYEGQLPTKLWIAPPTRMDETQLVAGKIEHMMMMMSIVVMMMMMMIVI